jgi:hypothetical protein
MEQTTVQTTQPEVTQPSQPTSALFATLTAFVETYIRDLVTAQVNDILLNHRTLRVIDDGFEKKIRDIAQEVADDAVSTHVDDEYHIGEDAINDMAVSALEDHDFDDKIHEAVDSAINDFDFSDVITASIKDNITFTVTVD